MEILATKKSGIETVVNANNSGITLIKEPSGIGIEIASETPGHFFALLEEKFGSLEVIVPLNNDIIVTKDEGLGIEGSYAGGVDVKVCLDSMFGHTHDTRYHTKEESLALIGEAEGRANEFTARSYENAVEAQEMLRQSLLATFTESISPITIQTMSLLVGAKELQFRYVGSKTNPTVVPDGIVWNGTEKKLKVPAGGIIQHMTLGITTISSTHSANEYRFWNMAPFDSGVLSDGMKKYWLYAKVRRTGNTSPSDLDTYILSEFPIAFEDNANYPSHYCLLVGLLSSEVNGERSWVTVYGFTEVLPGRITVDKIVSPSGKTYFDLSAGDGEGEIGGKIKFVGTGGDEKYLSDVVDDLQEQIDGQVIAWFQEHDPTLGNYPASEWTTDELKNQHLNDTFTNTLTGGCWRFTKVAGVYSWTVISDTATQQALVAAGLAQDTADGKKRVFTSTPTTPYDVGDLWSGLNSGDLKVCTTARATGSYVAGDWELASKYTDDSTAIAAALVGNPNLIKDGYRMFSSATNVNANQTSTLELTKDKTYTFSAKGTRYSSSVTSIVYIEKIINGQRWVRDLFLPTTTESSIASLTFVCPETGIYNMGFYFVSNSATVCEWAMLQEGDVYIDQNTAFKQTAEESVANLENLLEDSVIKTTTSSPSYGNQRINIASVSEYLEAQPVFENGKLYTISIENIELSSGTTGTVVLANRTDGTWSGTPLQTIFDTSSKFVRTFRIPDDGKNWVLEIYAGIAGSTHGLTLTLSNIMLQKGPFSTPWKPCLNNLTTALQGTTEIDGGLVLSNLIALRNALGTITAGISGVDEDITLWGGATYAQAVTASEGGAKIPVLLTKAGDGSNIGCLEVVDEDTVKINNGEFIVTLTTKTIAETVASLETVTLHRTATLNPVSIGNNTLVSSTLTKTATYNRFITGGTIPISVSYGPGYTYFGEDFMFYVVVNGVATQIGNTVYMTGLNPSGDVVNGTITIPRSVLDLAATAGWAVSLRLTRVSYSEGGTPSATATFSNCKIEFAEVNKQMIIANDGFCVSKDSKNVFKLYGDSADLAMSFNGKIGTSRGTLSVDGSGFLKLT